MPKRRKKPRKPQSVRQPVRRALPALIWLCDDPSCLAEHGAAQGGLAR